MSVQLCTLQRTTSEHVYQTFKYLPKNIMCFIGCNIHTKAEDVEGLRHASALSIYGDGI